MDTCETEFSEKDKTIVLKTARLTLTKDDFIFTPPSDLDMSGAPKEATVTAKDGIDCGAITVKYYDANNTKLDSAPKKVGTYTVKIDVVANDTYRAITDLEVGSFTILPITLTKDDITVTGIGNEIYTGSQIKPEPSVWYAASGTLEKDTYYTLAYGTNTDIGTGSVTINFKGSYAGSLT